MVEPSRVAIRAAGPASRRPCLYSLMRVVFVVGALGAGSGAVSASVPPPASPETVRDVPSTLVAGRIRYTVAPGDTLGGIAERYGVRVEHIRRWNNLDGDSIYAGQEIVLRVRGSSGERVRRRVTVGEGDTGYDIAREQGVSLEDLRRWNRGVDIDRLRPGQELLIFVEGGPPGGRGTPQRGRLAGGVPLEDAPTHDVRNPARAWGTADAVAAIHEGFARVEARFIDVPRVVVGDLSYERGGPMRPHASHQNGLDADVSYYVIGEDERSGWRVVSPEELDVERQWYLFRHWIERERVEYIFVDFALQRALYEHVLARGASEQQLREWFQYPEAGARRGIIRHEPGHDDHFHVRFRR